MNGQEPSSFLLRYDSSYNISTALEITKVFPHQLFLPLLFLCSIHSVVLYNMYIIYTLLLMFFQKVSLIRWYYSWQTCSWNNNVLFSRRFTRLFEGENPASFYFCLAFYSLFSNLYYSHLTNRRLAVLQSIFMDIIIQRWDKRAGISTQYSVLCWYRI